jgi:thiol-disulfide isomerase/thioredoxin
MRRSFALASCVFTLAASAMAASAPAPAAQPAARLLAAASARAQKSGRNVLVIFHASWCGWCRKFERFLELPEVKGPIDASYEVVWLDVDERSGKTQLENPGAEALYKQWSGHEGLPAYAVLDPGGDVLARDPGVGFPVEPQEIAAFIGLVRSTAPRVGPNDLERMKKVLEGPGQH